MFSNIISLVFPSVLIPGVFEAFDENRDGKLGKEIYINDYFSFAGAIDFKEFVCGISAACRGPQFERYKCKI